MTNKPVPARTGVRAILGIVRWRSSALSLLCFLLTAGATVRTLDVLLPPASDRLTTIKLDQFARSMDGTNTLLLGSSYVYHGVDPRLFDAFTKQHGVETKTFNMGVPAALLAESAHLLERVAELEPQDLRWILVEAENVAMVRDEGYFLTRKNVAWHSHNTPQLLWPYFLDLEHSWTLKGGALWRSLVAYVYNCLGVGRGLPLIERSLGLGITYEERAHRLGPGMRGYRTISESPSELDLRMRANYLRNRPSFQVRNAQLIRERRAAPSPTQAQAAYYQKIEELAASMGARAIFHTRQGSYSGRAVVGLHEAGSIDSLLRFDNARRFPALFELKYTFDGNHLLREGAELYSKYMGEAFLRELGRLDSEQAAPNVIGLRAPEPRSRTQAPMRKGPHKGDRAGGP